MGSAGRSAVSSGGREVGGGGEDGTGEGSCGDVEGAVEGSIARGSSGPRRAESPVASAARSVSTVASARRATARSRDSQRSADDVPDGGWISALARVWRGPSRAGGGRRRWRRPGPATPVPPSTRRAGPVSCRAARAVSRSPIQSGRSGAASWAWSSAAGAELPGDAPPQGRGRLAVGQRAVQVAGPRVRSADVGTAAFQAGQPLAEHRRPGVLARRRRGSSVNQARCGTDRGGWRPGGGGPAGPGAGRGPRSGGFR